MEATVNEFQERFYLILTGIFIASLVACNLIFQKFFTWNFLGMTFELSVGIIAYPVTFLVTDLISELRDSSSEALFSAEPTFLDKKNVSRSPSEPRFWPSGARIWASEGSSSRLLHAFFIGFYSVCWLGPPGTREKRTFQKRAVARKRRAFRLE